MVYTFAESAIWKQPLAKSTSSEAWQSSSEERYYAAVGKSMKRKRLLVKMCGTSLLAFILNCLFGQFPAFGFVEIVLCRYTETFSAPLTFYNTHGCVLGVY
jgi:hypothetical protein